MITKTDVETCFPELKWITNTQLREQVIEVWINAANQGKWKRLTDVPFTLLVKDSGPLIDHTRRIATLARSVSETRKEPLQKDYLIAGALLHDVGKLLEYEKVVDQVVVSELGKKIRHPVSGANLAKNLGLPEEVVHIIYAHSKEGDIIERSPEAIIVHHCDFIDFEITKAIKRG
ncbi:MAG: HD domain-containing protein [Methanobacteriota archaeon]